MCPTSYRTRHFFNSFTVSQQLDALQTHTTDTFLFISHTTNVLLFKFLSDIFIGVTIIKEMPGSVASRTLCITTDFLCKHNDCEVTNLWKPSSISRELYVCCLTHMSCVVSKIDRICVYWRFIEFIFHYYYNVVIQCFMKSLEMCSFVLCNKNQPDALFIVSLCHQSTSTCFGQICSPSSGGILNIYTTVVTCWPTNRQTTEKHDTYHLLYIYSLPPDDGL